jgi:hypothetical protein
MDLQEVGRGGVDWIDLAQDTGMWLEFVNVVMNFEFHKLRGISCLAESRLASQEGICAMEHVSKYANKLAFHITHCVLK